MSKRVICGFLRKEVRPRVWACLLSLLCSLGDVCPSWAQPVYDEADSIRVERLLCQAREAENLASVGRRLMGTPYVAGTLDVDASAEHLRVNLQGLDCMTFVETTLALVVAARTNPTFEGFCRVLQRIRYREGRVDGYASRMHYFSDWIRNNPYVDECTAELVPDARPVCRRIDFMTTHPHLYPALEADSLQLQRMKAVEEALSACPAVIIDKQRADLPACLDGLAEGDVVALTTSVEGLDVTHMGLVVRVGEEWHLLHASSAHRRVLVDPLPLTEYLHRQARLTGLRVLRLRTPQQTCF